MARVFWRKTFISWIFLKLRGNWGSQMRPSRHDVIVTDKWGTETYSYNTVEMIRSKYIAAEENLSR